MKLEAQEIKELVAETERKRQPWADAAGIWENDWSLNRYNDDRATKREVDGVDTIVSPDPYNIIQLLHRHVADEPRVEIPSLSAKGDDEDRSEKIEEFLVAYEQQNNKEQGSNLIHSKVWQSGVLGRGATQTLWMEPLLVKQKLSGKRLPISKRILDPRNVGVIRNVMGVECAYHQVDVTRSYIEEMYPDYKLPDKQNKKDARQNYTNAKYRLIDFWSRHMGSVIHHVVINDKTAKQDTTDYPDIPIIEWYGDGSPLDSELDKSLSILHPIHGLWEMKCDMWSSIATGLMYHFNPATVSKGSFNEDEKQAIKTFGPGSYIFLRENQSVEAFRAEPNVPLAQAMLQMIQTGIDQATFPSVSFGEGGESQSGYAINSLQQQANSRSNIIRSNIESETEQEYELFLSMIEAFAPDEGITIYGGSKLADRGKPLTLKASDIKGNYANRVNLNPELPMADTQSMTVWMNAHEKGLASRTFLQNRIFNIPMPRDEQTRIAAEEALKSPEMALKVQLRALQKTYKQSDWELMIVGTPLQQVHEQEQQWLEQKAQEAEQAKQQKRDLKQQQAMQEQMQQMASLGLNMPMGAGGLPPTMPPSMPPGQPQGLPPLAPSGGPGMGSSISGMAPGGAGPGVPSSDLSGMSPMGLPPQGQSMQPPGIPGVPGAMTGQLSPEDVGLPPNGPAGQFQQLTGQPGPSSEDILRQLGALPPQ